MNNFRPIWTSLDQYGWVLNNLDQEFIRKGWTETAIILYKLNKSLQESSISVGIHRQKVCIP